ncbi:hypothetical protein GCM10009347_34660 [Shewanella algicola]|uniref:Type II toxin-antitoxin system RelE/ParE family toxin n=2 Tax=Shewanella algicola TaxID=640633 RepID=A0A9X1Z8W6_9GAMM|nr:type II toxin-antitoxin system RelE/ParE family toxin [Shewanella algicola]MCL1107182.1 type II toxin-antitoxin system RelE/ParE family toxin [Shewanella algicola]GGP66012.1 hypothetical protein GCM10009347_34660 [Shewanella algicola]
MSLKNELLELVKVKSGDFRTIIAFNVDDKSFFIFGFSKNEKADISIKAKTALKIMAKGLLSYDNKQLAKALKSKALYEVTRDE